MSFAEAPLEINRNRLYQITDVRISSDHTIGCTVFFKVFEGHYSFSFRKPLRELTAIGMTLHRSIDDYDPAKKGNDDNGS